MPHTKQSWARVPCYSSPGFWVELTEIPGAAEHTPGAYFARVRADDADEYLMQTRGFDTPTAAVREAQDWMFSYLDAPTPDQDHDSAALWFELDRLRSTIRMIQTRGRDKAKADRGTGAEPPEANDRAALAVVPDEPLQGAPAAVEPPSGHCEHGPDVALRLHVGRWCQRCGALDRFGEGKWFRPFDPARAYDDDDHNIAWLVDYKTGQTIREASKEEHTRSQAAARVDGGAGVIMVDGRSCFVEGVDA